MLTSKDSSPQKLESINRRKHSFVLFAVGFPQDKKVTVKPYATRQSRASTRERPLYFFSEARSDLVQSARGDSLQDGAELEIS